MPLPDVQLSPLAFTFGHWLPREPMKINNDKLEDPFDLNAPYQRDSVWTIEQRQALIASLIMGLPTGSIVTSKLPFRADNPYSYRIVDGKQRVETARMWAEDKLTVPAIWFRPENLGEGVDPEGEVTWSTMSEQGRRSFIMSTPMPCLEADLERVFLGYNEKGNRIFKRRTEAGILKAEAELYLLLNGGGTPQTVEDMARAEKVAAGG